MDIVEGAGQRGERKEPGRLRHYTNDRRDRASVVTSIIASLLAERR